MEKETKLITLDRIYGFAIYLTKSGLANHKAIRNRKNYITNRDGNPILFKNSKMADLWAQNAIYLQNGEYILKLIKYDKGKLTEICKYDDMQQYSENLYHVITDKMIYFIKEQEVRTVKQIRYFVFDNGDVERTKPEVGKKRSRKLMNMILQASRSYFYAQGYLDGIARISSDEIEISFKNSSAKIHILTNGLIANINQNRKTDTTGSQYCRCLPFDSNLDKFTTFYSYVSKDSMEPDGERGFGFEGDIDQTIESCYEYIAGYLQDFNITEPGSIAFKYLPIHFEGNILIH